jgi:large subunit ribosomal protein L21
MYAVIESAQAVPVSPGDVIQIEKLDTPEGQTVDFSQVLMVSDDQGVRVGNPVLSGATVTAKVKSHGRDDKIKVFKMRRRKHYRISKRRYALKSLVSSSREIFHGTKIRGSSRNGRDPMRSPGKPPASKVGGQHSHPSAALNIIPA